MRSDDLFRTEYAALYTVFWMMEVYGRYWIWYMPNGVREVLEVCADADGFSDVLGNAMSLRDLYALMVV